MRVAIDQAARQTPSNVWAHNDKEVCLFVLGRGTRMDGPKQGTKDEAGEGGA